MYQILTGWIEQLHITTWIKFLFLIGAQNISVFHSVFITILIGNQVHNNINMIRDLFENIRSLIYIKLISKHPDFNIVLLQWTMNVKSNTAVLCRTGPTLKLLIFDVFPASARVLFTHLTMMSSLAFCPSPRSSRTFKVYLERGGQGLQSGKTAL